MFKTHTTGYSLSIDNGDGFKIISDPIGLFGYVAESTVKKSLISRR
jgi:hypothetical protein